MRYFRDLKKRVLIISLVLACLTTLVPATAVSADTTLPAEFYGNVTINGTSAPAGTTIIAEIENVERGRIVMSEEGEYGGPETFDTRLVVTGTESDIGKTIYFYVDGKKAGQSAVFDPGSSLQQDLSIFIYPLDTGDVRITEALDYLLQSQEDNGSIGGFAVSSWAVMAIAAAGEDPSNWKSGNKSIVEYLKDSAPTNLEPDKATDLERLILSIVAAGESPRSFGGVDYVSALMDLFDGTQMGDESLLNDDVWGILALTAIGEGEEINPFLVDFIKDNRNDDNGWGWYAGGPSDADSTAATISALIAGGESPNSSYITGAVDYLKSQQQNNGGFVSEGTTNSAVDSWVIMAINDLGQDPTGSQWVKNGNNPVGHLLTLQDDDGAFKRTASLRSNPEWMTAYAVIALMGNGWPRDTSPPVISGLAPSSGRSVSQSAVAISADYADAISGIDKNTARIWLDDQNVTADAVITDTRISYNAGGLSTGTHTVKITVSDKAGNTASKNWNFKITVSSSGGGGGGSAPKTTPTPTPAPSLPAGATDVSGIIDNNSRFTHDIQIVSQDLMCTLIIESGIKALTGDEKPLAYISIAKETNPPEPPDNSNIIGAVYDLGPDGAVFNPPIILVYSYDVSLIPRDADESQMVIAVRDSAEKQWRELESTVDPQTKTIRAEVSHFSTFAVIACEFPEEKDETEILTPVQVVMTDEEAHSSIPETGIPVLNVTDDEIHSTPQNVQEVPENAITRVESGNTPVNWLWIIIIIAGILVIGLVVLIIIRRRKNINPGDA